MALNQEERDLLIRIDERVGYLKEKQDEAFSGPPLGFVRHETYDKDQGRNTWFKRLVGGTILAAVIKTGWEVLMK